MSKVPDGVYLVPGDGPDGKIKWFQNENDRMWLYAWVVGGEVKRIIYTSIEKDEMDPEQYLTDASPYLAQMEKFYGRKLVDMIASAHGAGPSWGKTLTAVATGVLGTSLLNAIFTPKAKQQIKSVKVEQHKIEV